MFDYLRIHHDELLAHCVDGEQPLALAMVAYVAGNEGTGAPDSGVTVDFDGVSVDRWERGLDRLLGGDTLHAPGGGAAIGLRDAALDQPELMLTSRRLVTLKGSLGSERGTVATWWCPLEQVAEVRHDPRLLQAGRILVGFTDGSAIRLMAGMVSAKRAKTFANAFHGLRRG